MKKLLLSMAALFALASFGAVAMAIVADDPGDSLQFTKVAGPEVPVGGGTSFTIGVTNYGDAEFSQTLQLSDDLPDGIDWKIDSSGGWDSCEIDGTLLSCADSFIPGPAVIGGAIYHSSSFVTVVGIAETCGSYLNSALFYWRAPDESFRSVTKQAAAIVTCPATPTPPPTNTPVIIVVTATPTNTPVPQPTATPTLNNPVPTATATRRVAPLPPNTGNAQPPSGGDSAAWLYAAVTFGAIAFGLGGTAIARRSR